ncbi:MAG TPA: alanine--tRNA ligase [Methanosarcinales archaeon]|nr:alanine--tRNA ligase [Methanosarcinales archaeon]
MLEEEYKIDYFLENGFTRKKCLKCGKHFWTRDSNKETCGDAPCNPYTFIGNPVFEKEYNLDTMREEFLSFFESKGHTRIEKYPVIARWREDIYLTIASIADFQPYVTSGLVPPPANPLTISQPCIRLDDLDSVGRSGRHLTNFEMMAHHAFNNPEKEIYWKNETVEYCDNLLKKLGVNPEKVTYKEEPWAGGGNAGPCLETLVGGLELATLVFMDLELKKNGPIKIKGESYQKMPNYIVDTGYGLERFVWASTGSPTIYDAIFPEIVNELMSLAGIEHSLENPEYAKILSQNAKLAGLMDISTSGNLQYLRKQVAESIKIPVEHLGKIIDPVEKVYAIADHSRCLAFMFGDGIIPSNVKAGYLARLVIRRTLRLMNDLRLDIPLTEIVRMHLGVKSQVLGISAENLDTIMEIIDLEEKKYNRTIEKGTILVKKTTEHFKKILGKIPLEELIQLYDTHGIPPELTKEIAKKEGIQIQVPDNFYSLVAIRHSKATELEEPRFAMQSEERIKKLPPTKKLYYQDRGDIKEEFEAVVLDVFDNYVVLDQTMFYPEGGGQPSDKGNLITQDQLLRVEDVQILNKVIMHKIAPYENGAIKKGDIVTGKIDFNRRLSHTRHHTATHIVHSAAKKVLGKHIWQAGSQIGINKARLDLSHYKHIEDNELRKIELLANKMVMDDLKVTIKWMDRILAERSCGFELYQGGVPHGKKIRVVKVGDDVEACGGTHCLNTGTIGSIKILKTQSVQDGIERIEFSAGEAAILNIQKNEKLLTSASEILRVPPDKLPSTVNRFFIEWKELKKENARLKEELARMRIKAMLSSAYEINGIKIITQIIPYADASELVKMASELTKRSPNVVAILSSGSRVASKANVAEGGVQIVASSGTNAIKKGINAGTIVKKVSIILGGGGGGKPDLAQGGGKNANEDKIKEALKTGFELVKSNLQNQKQTQYYEA